MPLHTDLRPTTLDEFVGNETVITQFKAHLEETNPNRAILFVGDSGCGKTTLARILADKIDARGTERHELNTSDFGGIEMVREIRQKSMYRPAHGTNTWWLLDECHRLSPAAQEAILKLLEDPPPNTWITLATTDPQKLKKTLRRRCTEFALKPLGDYDMESFLRGVCAKQRKRIPQEVLQRIMHDALGSPGVALKILGQVIHLDRDEMLQAATQAAERENTVIELCRALVKNKPWPTIAAILRGLEDEDGESVRRVVLEYFRKILIDGDEAAFAVMDCFRDYFYEGPVGKAQLVMACYEAMQTE
jgi:DNA polymerase III gamma/tau subunit